MSPTAAAKGLTAVCAVAVAIAAAGLASSGVGSPNAPHVVEIRDLAFVPEEIPASVGDTIVFVNDDIVPHTVTALDTTWASEHLEPGDSWRMIVRPGGAAGYFCEYHPTMRGRLSVR